MRLLFDHLNSNGELYWAAGFFDGEGYVGTVKTNAYKQKQYYKLCVTIAQGTLAPLERFQGAVKTGTIYGPYKYGTNRKQYWQFNSSNTKDAIKIMESILPYLCSTKQLQYAEALKRYEELH